MSTATETVERSQARPGLASMIRRVKIRNYKSIKNCDVALEPFTILVGRNGAGKSNFLDAIRLVSEGLRASSDWDLGTLNPRSGVADDSYELPPVSMSLAVSLPGADEATYEVHFDVRPISGLSVTYERLEVVSEHGPRAFHECMGGRVVNSSVSHMPIASEDRLYLQRASAVPDFRPAFDAPSSMGFYDFDPDVMRQTQGNHAGVILARDGSNLASIWNYIQHVVPGGTSRIDEWLSVIVPQFSRVQFKDWGPFKTLVLHRHEPGDGELRSFDAQGLSDGTLRALGILVAINQLANDGRPIRLVGIEEPETALHPAAAGALMDAFRDAASHTQVLVTIHGADLLDRFDPEEDHILAVEYRDGRTEIGPVNPASRDAIREHLFSAGELLRMDQLHPDRLDVARQAASDRAEQGGGS